MSYEEIRQQYKPAHISLLLIAESPPPAAAVQSGRQFYCTDRIRVDDRLFTNTIWALYPETTGMTERQLEEQKESWLRRLQASGVYMIEALEVSQRHRVSKQQRQEKIRAGLPRLITRIRELVSPDTALILIKSNVFVAAAEPLRQAGFTVLNTELVDYPGQFNQRAYRQKVAALAGVTAS